VIAFRLHSFVLYSFDTKSKSTVVHLALTETRLTGSTAQERLYQILQMLQSDLVGSTVLTIAPHFNSCAFECSNSMVTSLPFDFVTKLHVGKTVHLPKEWKAAVKKDAQLASSSIMTRIQLWQNSMQMDSTGKLFNDKIYCVVYENTDRNQSSIKSTYVTEKLATLNLRNEPWILDHVRPLCSVRSYRQVVLGEGSKTSRSQSVDENSTTVHENYWYCIENHGKLCTEGAVGNMFFHMNTKDEAEEF